MLELVRKGNEVYHENVKLTIVEQATKGPGKEVVKIEGLDGSNGQKWMNLSKLEEGKNEVSCKGREVTSTGSYTLNMVEKAEIDKLQAKIDAIKETAKARYVAKPKFANPNDLKTQEQKDAEIKKVQDYLKSLKA